MRRASTEPAASSLALFAVLVAALGGCGSSSSPAAVTSTTKDGGSGTSTTGPANGDDAGDDTIDGGTATHGDDDDGDDDGTTGDAGGGTTVIEPDAGKPDGSTSTGDGGSNHAHIRLCGANLTSGNDQSYDPGNGARILQAMKPDVTMLQEFNYGDNGTAAIRGFVDKTFGTDFAIVREDGAQIPNGIISRFPVLTSGNWADPDVSNRSFVWARLDLPGSHELFAVSVHLLTTSASNRGSEASALVKLLKANVTAGDYITVGGDFNTDSRTEAALTNFGAILDVGGPYPDDQNGNSNTSVPRSEPHDWVLVSPGLTALQTATAIGSSSRPHGLVFDSRVFTPLSDATPVQAGDTASSGMQHLPVVRDFTLP